MPLIAASFKAQFHQGENEDSIKKEVIGFENQTEPFDKVSLNIGGHLYTDNQKKFYIDETIYKHCLGAVVCNNNSYCSHGSFTKNCPLKGLERRPKSTPYLIENQTCSYCQQLVSPKPCPVIVQFKQFKEGARCEMTHKVLLMFMLKLKQTLR